MLDVRESQCLYWNKNRLSHNCPHQNIHPHSWRLHTEYYCSWLQLFRLQSLRAEVSTQVTPATCFCQNVSILSYPSFFFSSLLTSFFMSCWVKCGWACLDLAKPNGCYLAWPTGEPYVTHSFFPPSLYCLSDSKKFERWYRKQHEILISCSFIIFSQEDARSYKQIHIPVSTASLKKQKHKHYTVSWLCVHWPQICSLRPLSCLYSIQASLSSSDTYRHSILQTLRTHTPSSDSRDLLDNTIIFKKKGCDRRAHAPLCVWI